MPGRFRVITPDFRGRGLSERDPDPQHYVPTTYAGDVLQLLDELDIERAIFVGTSLGGLVTMLIAAMQPQRIAATILNDVGPELDQSGIDRIRTYVGSRCVSAIGMKRLSMSPGSTAACRLRTVMTTGRVGARVGKEDGDAVVFDYDMAIAEAFNQRNDGAAPAFDLWPLYKRLEGAPLLIVRGELSDLLSGGGRTRVEAIPGAELVTVPGVGHAPELNQPEAIAAIDPLLAKVASTG